MKYILKLLHYSSENTNLETIFKYLFFFFNGTNWNFLISSLKFEIFGL